MKFLNLLLTKRKINDKTNSSYFFTSSLYCEEKVRGVFASIFEANIGKTCPISFHGVPLWTQKRIDLPMNLNQLIVLLFLVPAALALPSPLTHISFGIEHQGKF